MKANYAKLFIIPLCLTLLIGCDKPAQDSADGGPDTQPGSVSDDAIEIEVDDPTQSNTLTAEAAIAPAKVKAGDTVTFAIRAKTADSWHIYAFDDPSVGTSTTIEFDLPRDVEMDGQWVAPEAHPYPSTQPSLVYEGDMKFQHKLKIADGAAPGPREVKCKFVYQTCNDSFCNPPTSMELSAIVEVE